MSGTPTAAVEGPGAPTDAERAAARQAARRRRGAQADLLLLVLCAAVIVASIVLTPSTGQLSLSGVELPPLCLFKRITGFDCFGCGLSRSFTFMGHGRVADAFAMHKLGPLLWAVVLLQVPWRARLLWRYRRQR